MLTNLEAVFDQYVNMIDHPIVAVETGASSHWQYANRQYLSTLNIIRFLIAPTGGILFSLESDQKVIDLCTEKLEEWDFLKHVRFINGDSVDSIKNHIPNGINFAWFDSSEDRAHADAEYAAMLPLFAKKHITCVDDYGATGSVKWQGISEIIKTEYDSYKTFNTSTGLIVGYRS